jgi:hypothetical protein
MRIGRSEVPKPFDGSAATIGSAEGRRLRKGDEWNDDLRSEAERIFREAAAAGRRLKSTPARG